MADEGAELIPVEAIDGHYVVSEDWLTADLPFPSLSARTNLIRQGYTVHPGTLHWQGRACRAEILQPASDHDQLFAALEAGDAIPDDSEFADVSPDDVEQYWLKLYSRFGHSEGVLPDQCADISTDFVEPRLALAFGDQRAVTWGRLRENNYLLVSGAPGSGKTTLLRHWLLWHAERTRRGEAEVYPLCLPLRSFRADETVEAALRREAEVVGAPWLASDLKAYARKGALAIAFDGVDEVPEEDRRDALARLGEFTKTFPHCRYFVTTRPGISVETDVGLVRADLLPLDRARLRQFIYYRLHGEESWKSFATRVEAEPALTWVASNPLALTYVAARFRRRELKPTFIGEILSAVADLFLDSWDSSRGIVRTRKRALSPSMKRKLLAWVAHHGEVKPEAEVPLLETFEAPRPASALLATLSEHTGLLVKNAAGWAVGDRAFEDYFLAITWVSALRSRALEFRRLLGRPLSSARSNLAGLIAFMSSDADGQIDEVLRKLTEPDIATAVRLTDVISQNPALLRSTLELYARLITSVLETSFKSAQLNENAPHYVFSFSVKVPNRNETLPTELGEFVAALHRSRDGIGAEAVRAAIKSADRSYLKAIELLYQAEGKLHVARSGDLLTWTVAEIMPEFSSNNSTERRQPGLPAVH